MHQKDEAAAESSAAAFVSIIDEEVNPSLAGLAATYSSKP
jgi:hypothetical protein